MATWIVYRVTIEDEYDDLKVNALKKEIEYTEAFIKYKVINGIKKADRGKLFNIVIALQKITGVKNVNFTDNIKQAMEYIKNNNILRYEIQQEPFEIKFYVDKFIFETGKHLPLIGKKVENFRNILNRALKEYFKHYEIVEEGEING